MWILLTIYILMGILLGIYLRSEQFNITDCVLSGLFWPIFLIVSYIQYIQNN
jgi:hypothetical protein